MNISTMARSPNPVATLSRLAKRPATSEVCEFCSLSLLPGHRHLLETAKAKLVCVCDACALRFDHVIGRYRLIPRDARRLLGFQITDGQWNALSLPIRLAFFFQSTTAGRIIGMYPSPAGATESSWPITDWQSIAAGSPALAAMEPDVEALLANRLKPTPEYYVVPIDMCFELVGLMRVHWQGFSGGARVWDEIQGFFSRLMDRSVTVPADTTSTAHA